MLTSLWKRARLLSAVHWLYVAAGGLDGALIGYGPNMSPLTWIAAGAVVAAGVFGYFRFLVSASAGHTSGEEARSDPQYSHPGPYRRSAAFAQQNTIPPTHTIRATYWPRASAISLHSTIANLRADSLACTLSG